MTPYLQMYANKSDISLKKWNSQLFSPPYGSPYGPRSAASSCNGSPDYLRWSPNHFSDEHMSHGICPLGGIVVLAVIIIPTRLTFFSLQQQAGHGWVISRWDLQLTFEGLAGSLTGKGLFFLQKFFRVDSRDNFRFRVARLPGVYFGECNNG